MFLPRSSSRLAMYACIETLSRTSCPTPMERKAKRLKCIVPGSDALVGEAKTERVENIKETALKNEQDCLSGHCSSRLAPSQPRGPASGSRVSLPRYLLSPDGVKSRKAEASKWKESKRVGVTGGVTEVQVPAKSGDAAR